MYLPFEKEISDNIHFEAVNKVPSVVYYLLIQKIGFTGSYLGFTQ